MHSAHFTVLGFLVVGAAACSDPGAPAYRSQLLPLTRGTEWRYEQSDSVEIGLPSGSPAQHFDMRVLTDTTIGRERWAVVENAQLLLHDNYEGRVYLRNRADGLYERQPPSELIPIGFDLALRVFRYPAKRGDQSTAFPPSFVTATDTTIRVPAGEFRTIRYDIGGYTTYFVAPGVGIVKKVTGLLEAYDATGRLFRRSRLVYALQRFTPGS